MRTLSHSANLGDFDKPSDSVDFLFTDENFPRRYNAMTSRLQARIVKMFGWQLKPGYDAYLWVDSSCRLRSKDWFVEKLGDSDIAVFKHPGRNTVQQEADYLKYRLSIEPGKAAKDRYVTMRYKNEDIDGALSEVNPDDPLYASTAFIYRNNKYTQEAMKEWWYHTSRYHSIDQLGFHHAIKDLAINVIKDKYTDCVGLEYVRTRI